MGKLGHIAIDGTKIKANASKHKAMSCDRINETEEKLEEEVRALLAEAERVDAEEDAPYGKGKRADELPDELKRREPRPRKIRLAKAELEREAKLRAEAKAAEVAEQLAERARQEAETGRKTGRREPKAPCPDDDHLPSCLRRARCRDPRVGLRTYTTWIFSTWRLRRARRWWRWPSPSSWRRASYRRPIGSRRSWFRRRRSFPISCHYVPISTNTTAFSGAR